VLRWIRSLFRTTPPPNTVTPSFKNLTAHFERNGWAFETDLDQRMVTAGFESEHGQLRCIALLNAADTLLTFLVLIPNRVPRAKRAAAADFIARANYGLPLGKFEIDFHDGEVRFSTSSVFAAGRLEDDVIRALVGNALVTTDRYYSALMSVLYGTLAPEDAILIAEVEDTPDEEEERA
jgi:hypothetical protein